MSEAPASAAVRRRWRGPRAPGAAAAGAAPAAAALAASPYEAEMEWLAQAMDLRLKQHFAEAPS